MDAYRSYFQMEYDVNTPTLSQYWHNFADMVMSHKALSFCFCFEFLMYVCMDIVDSIIYCLRWFAKGLVFAVITNFLVFAFTGVYEPGLIWSLWLIIMSVMIAIFVFRVMCDENYDNARSHTTHLSELENPWITFWTRRNGEVVPINFVFDSMYARDGLIGVSDLVFDEDLDKFLGEDRVSKIATLNEIRQDVKYQVDTYILNKTGRNRVKISNSARKYY